MKIRERGPARVAVDALALLDRYFWGLVSLVAIALIVFVFGPRQMVLALIIATAAGVCVTLNAPDCIYAGSLVLAAAAAPRERRRVGRARVAAA